MNMFNYIFKGESHQKTTSKYMVALGMNEDQIKSVLNQKEFEGLQFSEHRAKAYQEESDPLYMEAQFDGTPEALQVWKGKVNEIKLRFPAPE